MWPDKCGATTNRRQIVGKGTVWDTLFGMAIMRGYPKVVARLTKLLEQIVADGLAAGRQRCSWRRKGLAARDDGHGKEGGTARALNYISRQEKRETIRRRNV